MASVSGVVIIAKIMGFVKQMVTANAFGATIKTDIISISEGLVLNLDYLLIQTLSTAFIPIYIYAKTHKSGDTKGFVSNTIKAFLLITAVIAAVFITLAPLISRILAPTYSDELSAQLAKYIRIFAPIAILLVEMAVFNSLLKANESFLPGEISSINQSVILIALILLIGKRIGPDTLVIGFYAYAIVNLLYLMVYSREYWSFLRGNPFKDENIRKLLAMMGPLLLGYSVIFVNQQVDKIIVSGLGAGTVTAMNYAAVLSNFINTFVGSICTVLFTYITQNIAERQDEKAAGFATDSTVQLVTLLLPVSILTFMNTTDIVSIVFGRGKFDSAAVTSCSTALIGYSFLFVPFAIRELYSRFQYAYEDSKTPMINSTFAIVVNIVLSILLSFKWGVLGVTLATSISVTICAFLNVRSSMKRNEHLKLKVYAKYMPGWITGIIACLLITYYGKQVLSGAHTLIRFAAVAVVSFLCYGILNYRVLKPMLHKLLKRNR